MREVSMQRKEVELREKGLPGAAVSTASSVHPARRMLQEMYQKHHLHADERFGQPKLLSHEAE